MKFFQIIASFCMMVTIPFSTHAMRALDKDHDAELLMLGQESRFDAVGALLKEVRQLSGQMNGQGVERGIICTGTLVYPPGSFGTTSRLVACAAHCLEPKEEEIKGNATATFYFQLGARGETDYRSAIPVEGWVYHGRYGQEKINFNQYDMNLPNDLAFLILAYSPSVPPLPLWNMPGGTLPQTDISYYSVGYGASGLKNDPRALEKSDFKRRATLLPNLSFDQAYAQYITKISRKGRDAQPWHGDSGGPLLIEHEDRLCVAGVTSVVYADYSDSLKLLENAKEAIVTTAPFLTIKETPIAQLFDLVAYTLTTYYRNVSPQGNSIVKWRSTSIADDGVFWHISSPTVVSRTIKPGSWVAPRTWKIESQQVFPNNTLSTPENREQVCSGNGCPQLAYSTIHHPVTLEEGIIKIEALRLSPHPHATLTIAAPASLTAFQGVHNAGTLVVNGTLATSNLLIDRSGVLQGNGRIDETPSSRGDRELLVVNEGVVAPEGLDIVGSFTQTGTGTLRITLPTPLPFTIANKTSLNGTLNVLFSDMHVSFCATSMGENISPQNMGLKTSQTHMLLYVGEEAKGDFKRVTCTDAENKEFACTFEFVPYGEGYQGVLTASP